jgi:hypothetical protein
MAGEDVVRVVMTHEDLSQSVDIRVDGEGRPVEVDLPRQSDANPERIHRMQPSGSTLSECREVDGFRLPTHVEAGKTFRAGEYFPFSVADVTAIRFPSAPALRGLPKG